MPELNEILNNAMKLPLHERAYLAEMLSKSIYERKPDAWTDTVTKLAGAWKNFPSIRQLRKGMGEDIPRESF
jgi:hypothetical protein